MISRCLCIYIEIVASPKFLAKLSERKYRATDKNDEVSCSCTYNQQRQLCVTILLILFPDHTMPHVFLILPRASMLSHYRNILYTIFSFVSKLTFSQQAVKYDTYQCLSSCTIAGKYLLFNVIIVPVHIAWVSTKCYSVTFVTQIDWSHGFILSKIVLSWFKEVCFISCETQVKRPSTKYISILIDIQFDFALYSKININSGRLLI